MISQLLDREEFHDILQIPPFLSHFCFAHQRKKDTETFFKQILAGVADVTMFDHFVKMPLEFSADFSCYKESVRLIMDLCPGLKLTQVSCSLLDNDIAGTNLVTSCQLAVTLRVFMVGRT